MVSSATLRSKSINLSSWMSSSSVLSLSSPTQLQQSVVGGAAGGVFDNTGQPAPSNSGYDLFFIRSVSGIITLLHPKQNAFFGQ
eukprot:scaffold7504_cov72-Skeletonema_dohrnii-CCMP3373.AAC.1